MGNEKQRHGRVKANDGKGHPERQVIALHRERRREYRVKSNGNG